MRNKNILLSLSGFSILTVLALTLLWGSMVGATHEAAEKGALEVTPGAVSPDSTISTSDRQITIKLTDINLDNPIHIGTGPDGEAAQLGSTADGEQLLIPGGQGFGLMRLKLGTIFNPISAVGGAPIVDRNHDGKVDQNDIEIVKTDLNGDGSDDISVTAIFANDPDRGIVDFNVLDDRVAGSTFTVRYATSSKELTRGPKVFTQTLDFPTAKLITDESFTVTLTNELATGDIAVATGDVATGGSTTSTGVTSATFTATALGASGDAFTVTYIGNQSIATVDTVVSGQTFTGALSTTHGGAADGSGIEVIAGNANATAYTVGTNEATFTATAALTPGDTITAQYLGTDALTVPPTGLHLAEPFTLDLKREWLPLGDTNADKKVNTGDITVAIVGVSATNTPLVTSIGTTDTLAQPATGDVAGTTISLVHTGSDLAIGKKLSVTYRGLVDLVTVKGANNKEIPVRLRETKPNSGIFQATIFAVDGTAGDADSENKNFDPASTATADRPHIAVVDGGSVVVTYKDQDPSTHVDTVRVQVEKEPPTFSNTAPDDKAVTNLLTSVLTTEVTDLIAGVNASTQLAAGLPESVDLVLFVDAVPTAIKTADISVTETVAGSGVWKLSYNISKIPKIKDAIDNASEITSEINWVYFAKDKAGNGTGSGVRLLKVINIKPVLVEAFAGDNWDPTKAKGSRLRSSLTGGSDDPASIRVVFNQPMDAASFSASDFQVEGVTVIDVLGPFSEEPESVFLIVSPPLTPNATPNITLVGSVSDTGGNSLSTGDAPAKDAIAPTLDITILDNFTKGDISLSVRSNEAIVQSLPPRTITKCTVSDKICTGNPGTFTTSSKIVGPTEWSFDLKGLDVGRYVIVVNVQDQSSEGVVKTSGETDSTATGAHVFEIDAAVPGPTAGGAGSTTGDLNTTPSVLDDPATAGVDDNDLVLKDTMFVTIRWLTEAREYVGDSHGKVTLSKLELDGTDIKNLSTSPDGKAWTVAIPATQLGATEADQLGTHTLVFVGTDEGLNDSAEQTLKFEVVPRPKLKISIEPGVNLISVPAEPADGSLDAIIGASDDIDLVATYEPDNPLGPWLIAVRDSTTGLFAGPQSTLTSIDSKHAYFVRAGSFVTLSIEIPTAAVFGVFPPTIPVRAGWNLVPVSDITGLGAGALIPPKTYFAGADVTRVFTFTKNAWVSIDPTSAGTAALVPGPDDLIVGKGYWVWAEKAGTIIP